MCRNTTEAIGVYSVSKSYQNGETLLQVLQDVNLNVAKGEFVAIVGSSGSGKSTLLHIMGGIDTPEKGTVYIDGINLMSLSDEERAAFRREHIGFVFQNYNLIPTLTIYENIILTANLDGKAGDEHRVLELTRDLEIDSKLDNYPEQLSGGEQQRAAIARALYLTPSIVLADEPTGSLDAASSDELLDLMHLMREKYAQTFVIVTHDGKVAKRSDRVIRISSGQCVPYAEAYTGSDDTGCAGSGRRCMSHTGDDE